MTDDIMTPDHCLMHIKAGTAKAHHFTLIVHEYEQARLQLAALRDFIQREKDDIEADNESVYHGSELVDELEEILTP